MTICHEESPHERTTERDYGHPRVKSVHEGPQIFDSTTMHRHDRQCASRAFDRLLQGRPRVGQAEGY